MNFLAVKQWQFGFRPRRTARVPRGGSILQGAPADATVSANRRADVPPFHAHSILPLENSPFLAVCRRWPVNRSLRCRPRTQQTTAWRQEFSDCADGAESESRASSSLRPTQSPRVTCAQRRMTYFKSIRAGGGTSVTVLTVVGRQHRRRAPRRGNLWNGG